MEESKLDNYVILPRYIKTDYFEGKLTKPERNLLCWLRLSGDPYGIATVSMDNLANDTFNNTVDKSYINKLLLSLKSKRYVWYSDRTGRRGSFQLHMGDLILPTKQIKRLDRFFEDEGVRGVERLEAIEVSEVEPEIEGKSQSLNGPKTVANKSDSIKAIKELLRGYDNDNNKEKENDKNSLPSLSLKKEDYSLAGFKVDSYEKMRCKEIAQAVGETDVAFCYGMYLKNGLGVLERAYKEFQSSDGLRTKDNPPAFFNFLVQEQLGNSGITAGND